MEESRLTPAMISPVFEVEKLRENRWAVHSENDKYLVSYDGTHYNCSCCFQDTSLPWMECDHVYSVKQFELMESNVNMQQQKYKAFADHLLWEIAVIEKEIASNDHSADLQIRRINNWREHHNTKLQHSIDKKAELLHRLLVLSGRKTQKLVHGELKLRAQLPTITINDNFDFSNESFVRLIPEKREPDIRAIRKHLTQTGEILPGVEIEMRPDKFSFQTYINHKGETHENTSEQAKTTAAA